MFNNFEKFELALLIQLCVSSVNAMDGNNINYHENKTEIVQHSIMNFISTCNNENNFTTK